MINMKNIVKIIILAITVSVFASCEYEIDYNDALNNDKMVVATFLEEDSTISFSVLHSAKPGTFDNNKSLITNTEKFATESLVRNCVVGLFANNQNMENLNGTNGQEYVFSYKPKHNDNIKITISNDKYPNIVSQNKINLTQPQIDSFNYYLERKDDQTNLIVYFEIKDDGNENYYQIAPNIRYSSSSSYFDGDAELKNASVVYESHQGVYQENNISFGKATNNYGVFANKKFRGQTYKLKLSFKLNNSLFKSTKYKVSGSFMINKIDGKSYTYLHTLSNYKNSSVLNTTPVIIVDGIENAYGFIGVKKTWKKTISATLSK